MKRVKFSFLHLTILSVFLIAAAHCGSSGGGIQGQGDATVDYLTDQAADLMPDSGGDTGIDGQVDDCDEMAKWIYLVASDKSFIRFRPDDLSLTVVGVLDCPSGPLESPFSMSVDRRAKAWVLYTNLLVPGGGTLYSVSTYNASCAATSFVPGQNGFEVFGMGFVSNSPGSSDETLYIAGGLKAQIAAGSATLGYIEMATLTVYPLGTVPQWPELTGTGLAELWGFFPESTPPTVQMIDKATGAVGTTYNLPELDTGQTEAWAFAFWGGDFYIFHKTMVDPSTNIWKLEAENGSVAVVVPNTGYRIVGAGVSTCAPVVVI